MRLRNKETSEAPRTAAVNNKDLEDLGEETMDLNAKDVCREVFEEMFRKIEILDLSLEHFMELIDISTKIYEVKDGQVGMFADRFTIYI